MDASAAAGVPAGVGYIERFHPALTELRARLQAGELGDVFDVGTRRTSTYPARIADVGLSSREQASRSGLRSYRPPAVP